MKFDELTINLVPGLPEGFAEALERVVDVYHERDGFRGDVLSCKVVATTEIRITQIGTVSVHGSVKWTLPSKKVQGRPAIIQGGAVLVEPPEEQEALPFPQVSGDDR